MLLVVKLRVLEQVAAVAVVNSEEGTVWGQAERNQMGILPFKSFEKLCNSFATLEVTPNTIHNRNKSHGCLLYCTAF